MDEDHETAERKKILEAEMTASPKKAKPGTEVKFEIKIINNGTSPLSNVNVKNCLPKGVKYISDSLNGAVSENVIDWDLGTIYSGGRKTITLKASVDGSVEKGPWINKAEVSGISSGKSLYASCKFTIRDKSRHYTIPNSETVSSNSDMKTGSKTLGGWSLSTIGGWSKLR